MGRSMKAKNRMKTNEAKMILEAVKLVIREIELKKAIEKGEACILK